MIGPYEQIALLLCVIASGFFSGSEAALLSISIDRAKQLIEEGGARGRAMNFMASRPNELLTTILVGNNVVNILAASLTTTIAARFFKDDAIGISVGVTTVIILIFGEIVPKTISRTHAENLAYPIIKILQLIYYGLYPIIKSTSFIIQKVLGDNAQISGRLVTKDDLEYMIEKAEKEKTIDSKQLDLLNSILEFPSIKVKDIMIPRAKVKYIKAKRSLDEIIEMVHVDNHSRYPVCEHALDITIGFLHVKDLAFIRGDEEENFDIKKYLKEPFFVYEHMRIQAVFDHMNRKKVHLALVKDETGLVVGIITLEDIVEEIFGEIQDEHDDDEKEIQDQYKKSDLFKGIVVTGTFPIRDLYNEFDIEIPLNDNFSTLAGFILDMLGNNFPEEGQIIIWNGYSFELSKVVNFEIKEIKIKDVDGDRHLFSRTKAQKIHDDITSIEAKKDEDKKEIPNK